MDEYVTQRNASQKNLKNSRRTCALYLFENDHREELQDVPQGILTNLVFSEMCWNVVQEWQ